MVSCLMQVRIDYATELIYSEKKKIRWALEEFEVQFGTGNGVYSKTQKILANQFLNYIIESVDTSHEEVLAFFKAQVEKLEKNYPKLFH